MKTITLIALLVILLGGRSVTAQTLQQVTDNGATTNNGISVAQVTANAPSFAGSNLPSHINFLNGYRINGAIPDASHNGITYQSGGGGGAAISFFRGGSYDTGIDFYTNIDYIPGNLQHRMRIASNGFVGIGTTNPIGTFHVRGNTFIGNYNVLLGSTGSFVQIDQGAAEGDTYSQIRAFSNGGNSVNNLVLQASGGNVAIGTTDPKGYKLAVAGNMIAESVKVQLQGSWPDYVFTKSYELPTLQETENTSKRKVTYLGFLQ